VVGKERRVRVVRKEGRVKGGKGEGLRVVGKGEKVKCRKGGRLRVGKGEGVSMFKGGKSDVCCLRVEEGCVCMININIKAKQFKSMHKILNGKNDNWNSIGKFWLKKYDQIYNMEYFFTTCSNFKGLQINTLPIYYQNLL
jgi:hypothetical protein